MLHQPRPAAGSSQPSILHVVSAIGAVTALPVSVPEAPECPITTGASLCAHYIVCGHLACLFSREERSRVAATLTGSGELLYASFPIEKVETDADGDLIVFGRASDGSVDADQQVVAPSWMKGAAQAWQATGANLRVQHNAQRDPAGIGLEVETDDSGATWVKGLVIEPIAKRLVAKGALRAYSVGIAHPTIERDPTLQAG